MGAFLPKQSLNIPGSFPRLQEFPMTWRQIYSISTPPPIFDSHLLFLFQFFSFSLNFRENHLKIILKISFSRHLNSQRETLPDVPAVYFVSPTESNIQIICNDLRKSMYDSYYFNMIYPLPRPLLEDLALSAVEGGIVQQVQKVFFGIFLIFGIKCQWRNFFLFLG